MVCVSDIWKGGYLALGKCLWELDMQSLTHDLDTVVELVVLLVSSAASTIPQPSCR